MKIFAALLAYLVSSAAIADTYVQGYTRKDGTYVAPHHRSESNTIRSDNYGSQGNSNPYTGQRGSQRNEYSDPPAYNQSNPAYVPQQPPNPYQQQRRGSIF